MKNTNVVFLVIAGIVLLGLGYGYGYLTLCEKSGEEQTETITTLPRYPLIQEWRSSAGGDVVEITDQSITVSYEGVTLTLAISEQAEISKTIIRGDELIEKIEDLSPQDVNVGDSVSLVIRADIQGNLQANIISIFVSQQE